MAKTMKIKIPTGYLIVEEKGAQNEYPGCWISFSKDGTVNHDALIACVEYDTASDDDIILTETYNKESDVPLHIIEFQTGEDRVWD